VLGPRRAHLSLKGFKMLKRPLDFPVATDEVKSQCHGISLEAHAKEQRPKADTGNRTQGRAT
jgi:hypothetical protein